MEEILVEFHQEAFEDFAELKAHRYLGGLAIRYYNELFRFPPEHWGRIRQEFGRETFVSDRHVPFDIRGYIEETHPMRTLWIVFFKAR